FTMLAAWRSAPEDAIAFRRVVRTNLAAWSRQLPILEQMLQHSVPNFALMRFVGADGKTLVTWDRPTGKQVVCWDTTTGQPLGPPFLVPEGERAVDVSHDGMLVSTEKEPDCFVYELSTGRRLGSNIRHRRPGEGPSEAVAHFCEPGHVVV